MNKNEKRRLFLDDVRNPNEAFGYTMNKEYLEKNWDIVRSYSEFVAYIQAYGIPHLISFDHDLAPSHYTPQELWYDKEESEKWQDEQEHEENTGLECAKWLTKYCSEHKRKLPDYRCHSMNPIGKRRILELLNEYRKNQNLHK